MTQPESTEAYCKECVAKMKKEGIEQAVIDTFSHYYRQVANGANGLLYDRDIEPLEVHEIKESDCLMGCGEVGRAAMPKTVRIVLNGGLGTTMGLTRAKSLIQAKNGLSFLEILLSQADNIGVPLCFMNSFSTHADTADEIARLKPACPPRMFLQHKFPKIFQKDLRPVSWPSDPGLEWNPPGHGDIYISLYTSGLLKALVDEGIEYAFISNSDNLGASLDLSMLGYFVQHETPFMMEVARRKPSDAKGGHLARHHDGQLILRESAMCPPAEIDAFQDISRYRFFNTNNLWINLSFLKALIDKEGLMPLPIILNAKYLDPRNENSPPVFQIETAMGSAISLFKGARAICVPRSRFLPVKSCNDLLSIRSDRYLLTPENSLFRNPDVQTETIRIQLDPRYFKRLDDFDSRFSQGAPSLLACESLTVEGNVFFGKNIEITGRVTITNPRAGRAKVPDGTVVDNHLIL